jgi:hypothetical protein
VGILPRDQKLLAQKSGNRCSFQGCGGLLTADATAVDRVAELGEIAHIIARSPHGPRGDSTLSREERDGEANLILLCTRHHPEVDSQRHTYTPERLRGMKEEHEAKVRQLGAVLEGEPATGLPTDITETVYSTLLPVLQMPRYVFSVECDLTDERVRVMVRPSPNRELAPYALQAGQLFSFRDLREPDGPFADLVGKKRVERHESRAWWVDADRSRWFAYLSNSVLNKVTGHRCLMLDKRHRRYYFTPDEVGKEKTVPYRPLNRAAGQRKVVWQPRSRRTGEGRGYWYHRAVSLRFIRIAPSDWVLRLRPELWVTTDSVTPLRSEEIGSKVGRKLQRSFNYDLLGDLNFWRGYLRA